MANVVRQRGYYNGASFTVQGLNQWNTCLFTGNFPVPRDTLYCTIVGHILLVNSGNNTSLGTSFWFDSVPTTGAPTPLPQSLALSGFPGANIETRRHTTLTLGGRDSLNLFLAIRLVGGANNTSQVLESSMMIWLWD